VSRNTLYEPQKPYGCSIVWLRLVFFSINTLPRHRCAPLSRRGARQRLCANWLRFRDFPDDESPKFSNLQYNLASFGFFDPNLRAILLFPMRILCLEPRAGPASLSATTPRYSPAHSLSPRGIVAYGRGGRNLREMMKSREVAILSTASERCEKIILGA
jgi:hypothetical protein